jgi:hypothetical protein
MVPNLNYQIRTHYVCEWTAKTRGSLRVDLIIAWARLAKASGTQMPPELTVAKDVLQACFALENQMFYSSRDGGPWAVATPRNIVTVNELIKFIAPKCTEKHRTYWVNARRLVGELSDISRRLNQP